MSGLDDLGRALRDDAAANAPRASVIDVDAVARAARARRAPRLIGVGTLALVGVLGLGGLAVGALAPPALIAASESASSTADESASSTADAPLAESGDLDAPDGGGAPTGTDAALACGAVAEIEPAIDDRLRLELTLPAGEADGDGSTDRDPVGSLRLINATGSALAVRSPAEATATVLRDGVVVGVGGAPADALLSARLEPGEAVDLVVRWVTVSCLDGTALPAVGDTIVASVDVSIDGERPVRLRTAAVTVPLD